MVQLSHPYMTTGIIKDLTIQTFAGKVMSLHFNTLSKFVIAFLSRSKCLLISWLQSPCTVILEPKKIKYPFPIGWQPPSLAKKILKAVAVAHVSTISPIPLSNPTTTQHVVRMEHAVSYLCPCAHSSLCLGSSLPPSQFLLVLQGLTWRSPPQGSLCKSPHGF